MLKPGQGLEGTPMSLPAPWRGRVHRQETSPSLGVKQFGLGMQPTFRMGHERFIVTILGHFVGPIYPVGAPTCRAQLDGDCKEATAQ